ncbi:MAG: adenosylcobinamide-phosphate synthase CbiB [Candidatus Caldatribacteriaceae bacterium]
MIELFRMLFGVGLDLVFGDPPVLHPVVGIGRLIGFLERLLFPKERNFRREFVLGFVVLGLVVGGLGVGYFFLRCFLFRVSPTLFFAVEAYFIFYFLAIRTLLTRGREVEEALEAGDLARAREALKHLVGRDTEHLSEREIVRGCVESLAENFNDGIVAPLFYIALFGALGGLVYKAASTLDSMLGYKDFRYYFFGFASARADDVLNFIPARLSAVFIGMAALFCGRLWQRAFSLAFRDAHKHPSPNAGWPESAMAGALGVRLGGVNYYQGKREERPFLGEPILDLLPVRIEEARRIIVAGTGITVFFFSLLALFFSL